MVLFHMNTIFPGYGDFHYTDKKVMRPSYHYNMNSYNATMTSIYWKSHIKSMWYVSCLGENFIMIAYTSIMYTE